MMQHRHDLLPAVWRSRFQAIIWASTLSWVLPLHAVALFFATARRGGRRGA